MINAIPIDLELINIKSVCEFINNYDDCNFYYDYQENIGYCTFSNTDNMTRFCIGLVSLLELIGRLNSRL